MAIAEFMNSVLSALRLEPEGRVALAHPADEASSPVQPRVSNNNAHARTLANDSEAPPMPSRDCVHAESRLKGARSLRISWALFDTSGWFARGLPHRY